MLDGGKYKTFIPGMPIEIFANCKVKQSTTMPLLRASISLELKEVTNGAVTGNAEDILYIEDDLVAQIKDKVTTSGKWFFYDEDQYFYYVGEFGNKQNPGAGDTVLAEVNATEDDYVVDFLNSPITFPIGVESSYSGYGIKVIIEFQAIQNYIPDMDTGLKKDNTITNSQLIFSDFAS